MRVYLKHYKPFRWCYFKFILFIVGLSSVDGLECFARYNNGTLGKETSGTISTAKEDIYAYNVTKKLNSSQAVIVNVDSNATMDYPLLVVVQQQKGLSSWTVPFSSQGSVLPKTSHVLCPADSPNLRLNQTDTHFLVLLSSYSMANVTYVLNAKILNHFMLKLDKEQVAEVTPSEPMINTFEFPDGVETVLVKAESSMSPCSVVSVQGTKCPIFDLARNVEFSGNFQTMRHKSGIVIQKDDFPSRKFYVVLVVLSSNERCKSGKNNENPFRNNDVFRDSDTTNIVTPPQKRRAKNITIKIVEIPSEDEYGEAIAVPIVVFLGFYLISGIIIWARNNYKKDIVDVPCDGTTEGLGLLPEDSPSTADYGSTEPNLDSQHLQTVNELQGESREDGRVNNGDDEHEKEFDLLKDIDEDKEIYRLKVELFLSDLSKKKRKKLHKKYSLYKWNLIIIAIFYALPVVQLVFTYQRVLNASGNQDICYYNFYCSRPLGPLSSFNNVYSNIGYVMLGLLFCLLVWRRDVVQDRESGDTDEHVGIPQHYGVFYALGFSLIMEGVLSACYHVCPSYTNFQFDTSFMYIIACLIMVQLYKTRHPDLAAKPHVVFGTFAGIILVAVSGVVFSSFAFWAIFSFALIAFSLYSTTQMYYLGRIRFSFTAIKRSLIFVKHDIFSWPAYKDRMVLFLLANGVNWSLAINGLVTEPKDFASYLLAILIINGLIYLLFYVIMKLRNKEKIPIIAIACSVLTLAGWAGSLTFFLQALTSWQKSPAKSRENNADCILFNFYDDHDVWHFLSAASLFLTFMVLLTLNDDLQKTPRSQIRVF